MSNLTTDELLKVLHSAHSKEQLKSYHDMIDTQDFPRTFSEYFNAYLVDHRILDAEVIQASCIPRTYAYQILNGTKNPGRNKVLALCIAAGMSCEETGRALALADAGKLYPRRKEDSIIIFALDQKLSVLQTNELLYEECGITL